MGSVEGPLISTEQHSRFKRVIRSRPRPPLPSPQTDGEREVSLSEHRHDHALHRQMEHVVKDGPHSGLHGGQLGIEVTPDVLSIADDVIE
jgi:hypothetical protein